MAQKTETQFHILPSLLKRFDRVGRELAFGAKDEREWRAWRRKLRGRLRKLIGVDSMQAAPLRPRVTESKEFDGYVRERVEIQTEPGIWMPMFVLIPTDRKGPFPAVLCPHGHCSNGKMAVVGDRPNVEMAYTIDQHNYDYGVQFVRAGFVALCPDARGFGERKESPAPFLAGSCLELNQMGIPLGQTVTGMWAWDLMRLVDYVATRKDCAPRRVGCAGLSGGGLQTLWLSALDDRVRCSVVSGYFYGFKESLLEMHHNCSCNYVPHLYETADMGDIGALIAPRPLLVETGDQDTLNGRSGAANTRSQARITRRAYKLLGTPRDLRHHIFPGAHRWHGAEAIPWMQKHLTD